MQWMNNIKKKKKKNIQNVNMKFTNPIKTLSVIDTSVSWKQLI